MKTYKTKKLSGLLLLFAMVFGLTNVTAQQKPTHASSEISYRVFASAIPSIQGESSFITAEIELNDYTNELENVHFEVPVSSFYGLNSEYLEWVGGFANPNLKFESDSIEKIDDKSYLVSGRLHFRNNSSPVEIVMRKKKSSNQYILSGNFNLRARDYFIGHTVSRRLVPTTIPFDFTLAFDKANFRADTSS